MRSLPPKSVSSTRNASPATTPPSSSTSLHCGLSRAARGQQVVYDQDPLPVGQRVPVQLHCVGAVLQVVADLDRLSGQLALFPDRKERFAQLQGQGGGYEKASGVDGGKGVDVVIDDAQLDEVQGVTEGGRGLEEGCDVSEEDAGLGEVGDVGYVVFEVHLGWFSGAISANAE